MNARIVRRLGAALGGIVISAALPIALATAEPAVGGADDTIDTVATAPPEIGTAATGRTTAHAGKVCVPMIGFLGDMHCLWK